MWPFAGKQQYQVVVQNEEEIGELHVDDQVTETKAKQLPWRLIFGTTLIIGLVLVLGVGTTYSRHNHQPQVAKSPHVEEIAVIEDGCPRRQEWRDLSQTQQQDYISAVLCLKKQPSVLSPESNYTSYDDFPWLHAHIGYATHHSAPFLPWHRYFLHIYENTLRSKCGYTGSLVYWDWTLDYQALENSPVFDPEHGFGGDGDDNGPIAVGRTGRCVVDGPFAGTEVSFYDIKYQPHCLSRGFRDLDGNLGHIDGQDISPESIEEVLSSVSYEDFVEKMESKVHDVIPFGIAGDFETFTAPYDPIFFLHHTQLDRLWWIWQQRQPDQGLTMYGGHKGRHSIELASLDDALQYRNLGPEVKVRDTMDIGSETLCYRY